MIIYGWGRQTRKNYGVAFRQTCGHCGKEDYWRLMRIRTWFTLFFIPIIPYSTEFFLHCPICERGSYLDRTQIETVLPLVEANQMLLNGKISEEEHLKMLGHKSEPREDTLDTKLLEVEVKNSENSQGSYCPNCGSRITGDAKFCAGCGKKTINNSI